MKILLMVVAVLTMPLAVEAQRFEDMTCAQLHARSAAMQWQQSQQTQMMLMRGGQGQQAQLQVLVRQQAIQQQVYHQQQRLFAVHAFQQDQLFAQRQQEHSRLHASLTDEQRAAFEAAGPLGQIPDDAKVRLFPEGLRTKLWPGDVKKVTLNAKPMPAPDPLSQSEREAVKQAQAGEGADNLLGILVAYKKDKGKLPTTMDELWLAVTPDGKRYALRKETRDPWGKSYEWSEVDGKVSVSWQGGKVVER